MNIANKLDNLEEMDEFLKTHNFPRLSHEEIENLSRLITSKDIESGIKNLPTDQSPGPDRATGELYQTFKDSMPLLLKSPPKLKRRECFQTYFTRPALPGYKNQIGTHTHTYTPSQL